MKRTIFFILISASSFAGNAQRDSTLIKTFNKKFRIGLDVNMMWSTVDGSQLVTNYFSKPSVGVALKGVYYFKPFVGASVGFGFQQLGAGILTPIKNPIIGQAPDSTYRTRLRFNTWQIPISIHLRTPGKFIIESFRFSVSFSMVPTFNFSSREVYLSLEPSLRVADVVKQYFASDMMYQFSMGPEIAAGTGILQVQFVYTTGSTNVYKNSPFNGKNTASGFRICYLF
jgi:hypothetical protein